MKHKIRTTHRSYVSPTRLFNHLTVVSVEQCTSPLPLRSIGPRTLRFGRFFRQLLSPENGAPVGAGSDRGSLQATQAAHRSLRQCGFVELVHASSAGSAHRRTLRGLRGIATGFVQTCPWGNMGDTRRCPRRHRGTWTGPSSRVCSGTVNISAERSAASRLSASTARHLGSGRSAN
jgi:hypothetical protein